MGNHVHDTKKQGDKCKIWTFDRLNKRRRRRGNLRYTHQNFDFFVYLLNFKSIQMKNSNYDKKYFWKFLYFTVALILFSYLFGNNNTKIGLLSNLVNEVLFPTDTFPPDTTVYEDEFIEDTIVFADGLDTIIEFNDSTFTEDSLGELMRDIFTAGPHDILIKFGGVSKSINRGHFGIHVGGMFDNSTLPNDGTSDYAWQWLIDLAPDVLRFPSGSYSKFMHLLHNADGTDAVGYGYDIYEIARYFDWTDDILDFNYYALDSVEINHILNDTGVFALSQWINSNHVEHFTKFREKWFSQQCVTSRYIDDFIALVNQLDSTYPGRPATKVILDLNILSETATECRAIADYLRVHNVNVVGVEMGNETYADFFCDAMEFHNFENYWSFINGSNLSGNEHVLQDNPFTMADMYSDHNFIHKFKTGGGFNYKIGVSGIPLDTGYAFRSNGADIEYCASTTEWNSTLRSHYEDMVSGTSKYKFDAVIMHTYYEVINWEDIPINGLDPITACGGTGDMWQYDIYDARLRPSFDTIIGIGNKMGNFKWFLNRSDTISFKASFNKFNDYFSFNLPSDSAFKKELWVTEWNLKDSRKGLDNEADPTDDADPYKVEIYSNGLTHGHLLFNWWLKNIKINFDGAFRQNFFTYATVQNYAGGTSTDLISTSDGIERDFYNKTECPYDYDCAEPLNCIYDDNFDKRNYHIRRTTYFVTYLLSTINKNSLKYLPSTFTIAKGNVNVQPTVFIDPNKEFVYVFFDNMKDTIQNIILDPDDLVSFFPGKAYVDLGVATITYLQGRQLYSNSGKGAIFNENFINACYDTNDHPFEIAPTTEAGLDSVIRTMVNRPNCVGSGYVNGCLSAPTYSIGYFKIPLIPVEDPFRVDNNESDYEIALYPNPTSTVFSIKLLNVNTISVNAELAIAILSMDGRAVYTANTLANKPIYVSNLAVGCYQVIIKDSNSNVFYKKLIKTE